MFGHRFLTVIAALSLVFTVNACEKSSDKAGSDQAEKGESSAEQSAKGGGGSADKKEARKITMKPVGNKMEYATTELTVKAGEKIHLVFENTADSAAMKHNVVILNTNDDEVATEIANKGAGLADKEYVPDNDAILAATDMSEPGETVEVTFTAPEEPGAYTYLCTFPGHFAGGMKGKLVVEG